MSLERKLKREGEEYVEFLWLFKNFLIDWEVIFDGGRSFRNIVTSVIVAREIQDTRRVR